LKDIYNCGCSKCRSEQKNLNLSLENKFKDLLSTGEKAFKRLHQKGSYKTDDLQNEKAYKELIAQTREIFDFAIQNNDIPEAMKRSLENDVYLFSGLKAHAQLFEASRLLLDDNGAIKSYNSFKTDFNRINKGYNQTYLNTEYDYAVGAAQMAGKWAGFSEGEDYNLQYRTAGDNHVRDLHAKLNRITLPMSDPFWDLYYAPNDWGCRCNVAQVLKDKYELSNSTDAMAAGEKATTKLGKNGENKLEIFRFNPGKQQVIFPPDHPYKKVIGAKVVEKQLNANGLFNLSDYIKSEFPTNAEIKKILLKYAELYPGDFRRGLDDVKVSKASTYLMQHSMNYNPRTKEWVGGSKISISSHEYSDIKFNPLEEFRAGLAAIKKGKPMSFNQEYSFESMWHEILHAKTNTKPQILSSYGVKSMETVNQFVARHTYPDFIKRLGGEAVHQNQILDNGYGYNTWVNDFRELLKRNKIDEKQASADLEKFLMDDYQSIGGKTLQYVTANAK
jgi:hypothetical protein